MFFRWRDPDEASPAPMASSSRPMSGCRAVVLGGCDSLPWPDAAFDAVVAINTIHNLDRAGCVEALREIGRVGTPGKAFVQVDAYQNDAELELFEAWMLTAQTYCKPEEWVSLFAEAGYRGDYFWTILEADTVDPAADGR